MQYLIKLLTVLAICTSTMRPLLTSEPHYTQATPVAAVSDFVSSPKTQEQDAKSLAAEVRNFVEAEIKKLQSQGFSDSEIKKLREKIAAEIFDESDELQELSKDDQRIMASSLKTNIKKAIQYFMIKKQKAEQSAEELESISNTQGAQASLVAQFRKHLAEIRKQQLQKQIEPIRTHYASGKMPAPITSAISRLTSAFDSVADTAAKAFSAALAAAKPGTELALYDDWIARGEKMLANDVQVRRKTLKLQTLYRRFTKDPSKEVQELRDGLAKEMAKELKSYTLNFLAEERQQLEARFPLQSSLSAIETIFQQDPGLIDDTIRRYTKEFEDNLRGRTPNRAFFNDQLKIYKKDLERDMLIHIIGNASRAAFDASKKA